MLDRKIAPDFIRSTAFDLIHPEKVKLPNDLDLFFIRGGSQDVLKIELVFNAGRWYESQWGAAYFTANLLTKGTRTKTSFEIAQTFDLFGAHIEISPGLDFVSVSLYSLTKNLQPVLSLLLEILSEPSFPEKEFEQSKAIYLQNLTVNYEKTSFLASKHFRKSLFGENHPYGKELEEADVQALSQRHFISHYRSFFQHFVIFVSGRWDSSVENTIVKTFSEWKTSQASQPVIPAEKHKLVHQYLEKDDSVQSSIRMGRTSVLRTSPDYVKSIFVAHLLGGYFGSRLMKNIREEKGLTYGIHSSIHALKHDSYLVIGADVNKENIELTFAEIRKELKKLRTDVISPDELDVARNHFIGSLQSEITTPFAHADKLKTIYLFSLPPDYYQLMISGIARMTASDILETSEKYFHEEQMFEIAVG